MQMPNETLMGVIYMAVVLIATLITARFVKFFMNKYLLQSMQLMKIKHTQISFLKHMMIATIYILGIGFAIYMLPGFRNLSLSILASSGVVAVVVGFASQHALSNIVSGIFITIFRPFAVEDRIKIPGKDISGVVEDITLRHTIIKTFENKRIVIPNSIISTEIIENANLVEQKVCEHIEVGVSYDSDVDKAIALMQEEVVNHDHIIDNRSEEDKRNNEPVVPVRVVDLGDSAVVLRAWAWFSDPPTGFKAKCELRRRIKKRFDAENIEIPFPHRTIVHKEKGKVL